MTDLIFVEQKPMEGREQTLGPGATIGREGCDVNLMDPEVSRRHATLRDQGGSLAIEDLGSTNGTFVNDQRVVAVTVLRNGDVVRLGNTVWAVRAPAAAGAGATTVGQVQPGAPQVTAARAVPTDIDVPPAPAAPAPPAAAPPVPPAAPPQAPAPAQAAPVAAAAAAPQPAAAAPQQPAEPAAPSSQPVGRRGDVEQPPDVAPSAIRRVLPPPAPGQAPAFQAPGARPGGSAATRVEATVVCMLIVAAVAAALVVYFATY